MGRVKSDEDRATLSGAEEPPLTPSEARAHALRFLEAWNTEQVGVVLAAYTENVTYQDPNTRGEIRGREALGRYLKRLLGTWTMSWTLREVHPYAEERGYHLLWRGTFRRRGGEDPTLELDGMDLVLLSGPKVLRNEVRFDRGALAGASGAAPARTP